MNSQRLSLNIGGRDMKIKIIPSSIFYMYLNLAINYITTLFFWPLIFKIGSNKIFTSFVFIYSLLSYINIFNNFGTLQRGLVYLSSVRSVSYISSVLLIRTFISFLFFLMLVLSYFFIDYTFSFQQFSIIILIFFFGSVFNFEFVAIAFNDLKRFSVINILSKSLILIYVFFLYINNIFSFVYLCYFFLLLTTLPYFVYFLFSRDIVFKKNKNIIFRSYILLKTDYHLVISNLFNSFYVFMPSLFISVFSPSHYQSANFLISEKFYRAASNVLSPISKFFFINKKQNKLSLKFLLFLGGIILFGNILIYYLKFPLTNNQQFIYFILLNLSFPLSIKTILINLPNLFKAKRDFIFRKVMLLAFVINILLYFLLWIFNLFNPIFVISIILITEIFVYFKTDTKSNLN